MADDLTRVQYLALLCMATRPVHGYALRKEIARRSGEAVTPGPASVHRTIRQLWDAGLVKETHERPDPAVDDPRRRYFVATEQGLHALERETSRWLEITEQAREALAGGRE